MAEAARRKPELTIRWARDSSRQDEVVRRAVEPPQKAPSYMSLQLINIRCGPGAAILPPEVTRIHMDFATKINGGHMGARFAPAPHSALLSSGPPLTSQTCNRKFWREYLPRLKYHNPSIPMIVNRHDQSQAPPTMTVYLRTSSPPTSSDSSSSAAESHAQPTSSRTNLSKAQPPGSDERVVSIDMKDKHSSDILEFFMAETRAKALQPTKEEIAEMQGLEAANKQAVVDRERVRQLRSEKKKEEDMLKRARAAGGMGEPEAV
ncbi:Uncharacterized protein TCAP_01571 [Tolypocladium capitatum]|uniref:Ribosomal protein/NADH dehydrogenase domain-containing protein n=1 Tax=Tolypocladium capitatum TaxID=45235 RepID=A0A2K3QLS6_9HYPO|nr:Uncharacterized protein TCAP_01571 [Tolypocladium capitatum]